MSNMGFLPSVEMTSGSCATDSIGRQVLNETQRNLSSEYLDIKTKN